MCTHYNHNLVTESSSKAMILQEKRKITKNISSEILSHLITVLDTWVKRLYKGRMNLITSNCIGTSSSGAVKKVERHFWTGRHKSSFIMRVSIIRTKCN